MRYSREWAEALGVAMTPATKEQRELAELRTELDTLRKAASIQRQELMVLREMFRLGWRDGELQWRLTAAAAHAIDANQLLKIPGRS